jgi:hypothetical protein
MTHAAYLEIIGQGTWAERRDAAADIVLDLDDDSQQAEQPNAALLERWTRARAEFDRSMESYRRVPDWIHLAAFLAHWSGLGGPVAALLDPVASGVLDQVDRVAGTAGAFHSPGRRLAQVVRAERRRVKRN